MDAVDIMVIARNIGRRALAEFFTAMAPQKAHWYNLMAPSISDPSRNDINRIFPQLSSLLNIEIFTMDKVLEECGLCRKKADKFVPVVRAWGDFIAEYKVDIELTMFLIGNKRRHFIRIGSFDKTRHPAKMPVSYWRDRLAPPKLRINKLTSIFAKNVGRMNIDFDEDDISVDSESESSEYQCESETEQRKDSAVGEAVPKNVSSTTPGDPSTADIPDEDKFPLLHSLRCTAMIMDRLVQEILLYHGNKRITFTRGNNRKGTLLILPSH